MRLHNPQIAEPCMLEQEKQTFILTTSNLKSTEKVDFNNYKIFMDSLFDFQFESDTI